MNARVESPVGFRFSTTQRRVRRCRHPAMRPRSSTMSFGLRADWLKRAEYAVPECRADAEVDARSLVMDVVQSVKSAPVRAARDVGVVMVFPMVQKSEVVVPGVQPEDQKRGGTGAPHESKDLQIASEAVTIVNSGAATSAAGSAWWCAWPRRAIEGGPWRTHRCTAYSSRPQDRKPKTTMPPATLRGPTNRWRPNAKKASAAIRSLTTASW